MLWSLKLGFGALPGRRAAMAEVKEITTYL
jgi:hypothetical protein